MRDCVGLCLLALLLFSAVSCPVIYPVPSSDAGLYLYCGQTLVDGRIPYKDVWLDKGPMVFFINGLGVLLGRGTAWGAWLLQAALLCAGVCAGFSVISQAFDRKSALIGSVVWICSLPIVMGKGHYIQQYAMPLQWLGLLLFWLTIKHGRPFGRSLALGALAALSFLLLPNLIGLFAAVALFSLLASFPRHTRPRYRVVVLAMALGGAAVVGLCLAYFAANGALAEYRDCTLTYGARALESSRAVASPAASIKYGLKLLPHIAVGVTFWAWAVVAVAMRRPLQSPETRPLLLMAALWMPIELAMATISGRQQQYYFVMWLPVMGLFSAFGASRLAALMAPHVSTGVSTPRRIMALVTGTLALSVALIAVARLNLPRFQAAIRRLGSDQNCWMAAQYVRSNTNERDNVLVWGAAPQINFMSQRRSPTRFAFQTPLMTRGYQRPEMVSQLLRDLREAKPVFVVSVHDGIVPDIKCSDLRWPCSPLFGPMPEVARVPAFVRTHYCLVRTFGDYDRAIQVYALDSFARKNHLGPYAQIRGSSVPQESYVSERCLPRRVASSRWYASAHTPVRSIPRSQD